MIFVLYWPLNFNLRLSTIRTADKIVAIKDGQVVETGSHEELMNSKGLYHALVLAQTNQEFESLDSTEYPGKGNIMFNNR
jgi:ABC-type enterochelin transport system ATPase subunit